VPDNAALGLIIALGHIIALGLIIAFDKTPNNEAPCISK
jgi:hypothetical protein